MDDDRERLRTTFDQAADLYHDARPDYPERLFDRLVELTSARPGGRVLEVGAGTGKATLALARRGLRVTALEPGPALAAHARANLAGFPDVDIVESTLEDLPASTEPFNLVVAATSWHWVDPGRRYALAAQALRPGGHLAFWSATHVFPPDGDSFFDELQPVYDEIGSPHPPDAPARPAPGELPDESAEIEQSGLFTVVAVEHLDWTVDYDAEAYIRLLSTFSSHIAMSASQRDRLFGEIRRRIAERPTTTVRRGWGAVLHVARRSPSP